MVISSQQSVPTVNIILSYDVDAMIAFQKSGTLSAFVDNRKKYEVKMRAKFGKNYRKGTHVFTNGQGSSFVGLEHTWREKGGSELSIELIDTEGDFEEGLLADLNRLPIGKDPVAAYFYRKEQDLRVLKRNKTKFEYDHSKLLTIENSTAELRKIVTRLASIEDTINDLESELDRYSEGEQLLSKQQVINKQKNDTLSQFTRPVFISYGCGESLVDWAPIQTYGPIMNLEYSFSGDGVPIIKIIFAPDKGHFNLVEGFNFDIFGPNFTKGLLTNGYSDQLFNEEATIAQVKNLKNRSIKENSDEIIDNYVGNSKRPQLHLTVKSAVERFIRNATNYENVLVLLPDLDEWLHSYFQRCINSVLSKVSQKDIVNSDDFGSGPPDRTAYNYVTDVQYFRAFEEALEGLGLKLVETVPSGKSESIGNTAIKNLEEITHLEGVEDWFEGKKIYAKMECDHVTQTFLERLSSLGKAITTHTAEGDINMLETISVETDFELLSIMEEHGLIQDSTLPCLLWGSQVIITEFLQAASLEKGTDKQQALSMDKYVHPVEQVLGFDLSYMKEVVDTYNPPGWNSPFGPQNSKQLDNLAFLGDTNILKEDYDRLKKESPFLAARLPVFSFGTKNSNILSVDFDINSIYFTAFGSSTNTIKPSFSLIEGVVPDNFKSKAELLFTTIEGFNLSDLDEFGVPKGFRKLVKPFYDINKYGPNEIYNLGEWESIINNSGLISDIRSVRFRGGSAEEEYYSFMWKVFSSMYLKLNATPTSTRNITHPDPEKKIIVNSVDMNTRLSSLQLVGDITTVPLFHISSQRRALHRPCLLYCVKPQLFTSNPKEKRRVTWFSGIYEIFGFKHKITPMSAESVFTIVKDPRLG